MRYPIFLSLMFSFLLSSVFAQNPSGVFFSTRVDGDPALEIIGGRQQKAVKTPPLLFVHGYRMGAWIFEDNYLPFFHDRGYEVFAVNLRGHGRSEGAEQVKMATLDDYYADLERVVAHIEMETGVRPVLIGYSMGAVLTQRFIAEYEPTAAVLVGMGDLDAALPYYRQWGRRHFHLPKEEEREEGYDEFEVLYHKPDFHRALFFEEGERPAGHKKYVTQMTIQPGSSNVWPAMANFAPDSSPGATAVLILAGDQDPLTPPAALQRAQDRYGAEVVVLENTRNGIPVGENWKKGAKSILRFLRQLPEGDEKQLSLLGAEH